MSTPKLVLVETGLIAVKAERRWHKAEGEIEDIAQS